MAARLLELSRLVRAIGLAPCLKTALQRADWQICGAEPVCLLGYGTRRALEKLSGQERGGGRMQEPRNGAVDGFATQERGGLRRWCRCNEYVCVALTCSFVARLSRLELSVQK